MESKGIKVLVVEDNPSDERILREAFATYPKNTFDPVYESCLQGALKRLSREKFEAILLDLFLPDAFGLETLQKVQEVRAGIPIVVWTGLHDQRTALQALELGARCYLVKDFLEPGALIKALRGYVTQEK